MRRTLVLTSVAMMLVLGRAHAFTLRNAPALEPRSQAAMSSPFQDENLVSGGSKSTAKAVFYSLLVPGLGQRYLGETGQSRLFFSVEAAIWTSFTVFRVQGHLRENEYEEYAQAFARVTSTGHSDDYYRLLTQYDSFQEYEDEIKSEGRAVLYPDVDAATLERYFIDHRVADYEPWVWQSAANRRAYQDRRSASKRAYRRGLYAVATALANRAASAFFAYRSARRPELVGETHTGFYIEFGTPGHRVQNDVQTGLSFVRDF